MSAVIQTLADAVATWRLMRAFGHGRLVALRAILKHAPGDFAFYRERGATKE